MRIKKGFVMQKIAGKTVVVSTGELSREFHGMIELNETAAFIWQGVVEGKSIDVIASDFAQEFAIPLEKATDDVTALVAKMKANGVVEDD